MGRTPFLSLALLLALAAPAAAADPPPLAATLAGCNVGPKQSERFAVFVGSMPARAGTARMAMRFDLLERRQRGTAGWRVIHAPRFGRWQRSKRGKSGFIYTKRVEGLREGAEYQAVVKFRWYDADGRLLGEQRRRTASCVQPDQRPDLRVESLTVTAGSGGDARYAVTIVNDGLTAAGAFDVGLTTADRDVVRSAPGLAAGERTTIEITAPACAPGDRLQVQVDVKGDVAESDERDNGSVRLCSDASGSAG